MGVVEAIRRIARSFRSAFIAGVVVVVPFAVTLWLVLALGGLVEQAVLVVPEEWRPANPLLRSGLAVGVALALVTALGFATRNYVGHRVIAGWEEILLKVPFVSSVYQGVKQVIGAIFSGDKSAFEKVVVVEWPRRGVYTVGFLTGRSFVVPAGDHRLVNVFLPTTPNPTTGFFFMVPEDQVSETDLSVEEAFKLIISAGIVSPDRVVGAELGPVPDR